MKEVDPATNYSTKKTIESQAAVTRRGANDTSVCSSQDGKVSTERCPHGHGRPHYQAHHYQFQLQHAQQPLLPRAQPPQAQPPQPLYPLQPHAPQHPPHSQHSQAPHLFPLTQPVPHPQLPIHSPPAQSPVHHVHASHGHSTGLAIPLHNPSVHYAHPPTSQPPINGFNAQQPSMHGAAYSPGPQIPVSCAPSAQPAQMHFPPNYHNTPSPHITYNSPHPYHPSQTHPTNVKPSVAVGPDPNLKPPTAFNPLCAQSILQAPVGYPHGKPLSQASLELAMEIPPYNSASQNGADSNASSASSSSIYDEASIVEKKTSIIHAYGLFSARTCAQLSVQPSFMLLRRSASGGGIAEQWWDCEHSLLVFNFRILNRPIGSQEDLKHLLSDIHADRDVVIESGEPAVLRETFDCFNVMINTLYVQQREPEACRVQFAVAGPIEDGVANKGVGGDKLLHDDRANLSKSKGATVKTG